MNRCNLGGEGYHWQTACEAGLLTFGDGDYHDGDAGLNESELKKFEKGKVKKYAFTFIREVKK